MGYRYFKRIRLAPGLSINLSKSGPSFSFGPRGLKYTIGPRGTRKTFGIPGTGMSYTTTSGWSKRGGAGTTAPPETPVFDLGFFGGMFIPPGDKCFVDGLKLFLSGKHDEAQAAFATSPGEPDAVFMSGFLALGKGLYASAENAFTRCHGYRDLLGRTISKYSQGFHLSLQITEFIDAPIQLDERGLALAEVEAFQKQGKYIVAISSLDPVHRRDLSDLVLCLSLCDLIVANPSATAGDLQRVVQLTAHITNDEPIHTNLLYLRGAAMYRMHMLDAALSTLGSLARKRRDRPDELLHQIRYLRGRLFEQANDYLRARKEYELILAENPLFKDVRVRVGMAQP